MQIDFSQESYVMIQFLISPQQLIFLPFEPFEIGS